MPKKQRIIIIAGPNGAGKTTFAREYLVNEAHCPDFINVDLIAAGLSPFEPRRAAIQAGRIMLSEIQRRVRKRESFAFDHVERTCLRADDSRMEQSRLPSEVDIPELTQCRNCHIASGNESCARWSQCEQHRHSPPL